MIRPRRNGRPKKYSEQYSTQFRLTALYADDMVSLIHDDIIKATTILDIGCGTGVFAQAYLRAFPQGIPGQTIICSDIAPSMIEQAQTSIEAQLASLTAATTTNCATQFQFQLEDGSQLSGIADHSIDIVVSVYGVFLIPDQVSTLQSIRRVLTPQTGIFANAAWTKHDAIDTSFGGNLQDVFMRISGMVKEMIASNNKSDSTNTTIDQSDNGTSVVAPPTVPPAFLQWFEPSTIATNLQQQQYRNVKTYRMFHSMTFRNIHIMLQMCLDNPMIQATDLSEEQLVTLKDAFVDWCQIPYDNKEEKERLIQNHDQNVPFIFWSASNLIICQVDESSTSGRNM